MMEFDQSFFKEEIRCDFPVTEKRKKIWHTEIQLLLKLDEVCKKYHLTYFVEYGTLLGAVRHQGFIPWDDDIDVVMFRDDYEKFQKIASAEFSDPYFFQSSYTDLVLWPYIKIRDGRTTAIEFPNAPVELNQGIFLDIFPLDDVPDNKNFIPNIRNMQIEIWQVVTKPETVLELLKQGNKFVLSMDVIFDLLKLSENERFQQFEAFNLYHFGTSEKTNFIMEEFRDPSTSRKKEWYSDVVYLPFEYISVPVPIGYDQILKCQYGNYNELVQHGSFHENIFFDPDIPYLYYMNHREKLH